MAAFSGSVISRACDRFGPSRRVEAVVDYRCRWDMSGAVDVGNFIIILSQVVEISYTYFNSYSRTERISIVGVTKHRAIYITI